jgi:hypothetical protein
MLGALAVLAILGYAAFTLLIPPTSGPHWRLDADGGRWEPRGAPENLAPTVVTYSGTESTVGFGITVFGSSSCPPRLRSVRIDDGVITVHAARDISWVLTGCTADAGPHSYGVLIDRDAISAPITVVVHTDETPTGTATFDELP